MYLFSAVFLYKERTLLTDSAFCIFKMINSGNFFLPAEKYSTLVPQIFALAAINLHLPLKYILIFFSLSFVFLHIIIYWIIAYKLKNEQAGILLILCLTIGISRSFFSIQTEIIQGIAYCVLFYAWIYQQQNLNNFKQKIQFVIINSLIVLLALFSHPVTIVPLIYILGTYLIDKNDFKNYWNYIPVYIIFIFGYLKMTFASTENYDGTLFSKISYFFSTIREFRYFYSTVFFVSRWNKIYFTYFVVLFIVIIYFFVIKNYKKLFFHILTVAVFFIFIALNYYSKESILLMEKNFIPLNIILLIPFINDVITKTSFFKILKNIAIVFFILLSVFWINKARIEFSERVLYIEKLLKYVEKFPERKFIIEKKNIAMPIVNTSWSFANETLLYSSLPGSFSSRTIYLVDDINSFTGNLYEPSVYFSTPENLSLYISKLNQKYFNLGNEPYRVLRKILSDPENPVTIAEIFSCNVDWLGSDSSKLLANYSGFPSFLNMSTQSNEKAHTGKFSVKLNKKNSFGFTTEIVNVLPGDRYEVSVWRWQKNKSDSYLVVTDKTATRFYLANSEPDQKDSLGWELIRTTIDIPFDIIGENLSVYVWSKSNVTVYFDDIKILKFLKVNKSNSFIYIPQSMVCCSAEKIDNSQNCFLPESYPSYEFSNQFNRIDEKAHSGKYSTKLDFQNPFGMTFELTNVSKNERFNLQAWRSKNDTSIRLVASATNSKEFYLNSNKVTQTEDEWAKIEMSFTLPVDLPDHKLKFYVWNNGKSAGYVDDFSVTRFMQISTPTVRIAFSDIEELTPDNKYFKTTIPTVTLPNAKLRNSEKVHSGKFSVKTTKQEPFVFTHRFENLKTGDRIKAGVWRWAENDDAILVMSATNQKELYRKGSASILRDKNGWEYIMLDVLLYNAPSDGKLDVYVWNRGDKPAWFDDYSVIIESK